MGPQMYGVMYCIRTCTVSHIMSMYCVHCIYIYIRVYAGNSSLAKALYGSLFDWIVDQVIVSLADSSAAYAHKVTWSTAHVHVKDMYITFNYTCMHARYMYMYTHRCGMY